MKRFNAWVVTNDTYMFHFVNHQLRCKVLDYVLPKITHLGGATFTISFLLMLLVISVPPVRFWTIEALLSLALSHMIVHLIKKNFRRQRPYLTLNDVNLSSSPLKDFSFPSGHTTAFVSIAVVFSLHSVWLMALLLPLALLVGFSRMYLGLHYPTDCFIGALIGITSSIIIVSVFN